MISPPAANISETLVILLVGSAFMSKLLILENHRLMFQIRVKQRLEPWMLCVWTVVAQNLSG